MTVRRSEIPDGGARVLEVRDDLAIALFRSGNAVYAIDNRCPHKGGPLGEGRFDGVLVTCPWHGFTVDVRTGACGHNRVLRVRTFSVEQAGEELRIAIPPAP